MRISSGRPGVPPPLIMEESREGRRAVDLPEPDVPEAELPGRMLRESNPDLPEVSELDVVRHYTRLSQTNTAIDTTFYPLGSCTMKYNPKVNEMAAAEPGFAQSPPLEPEEATQGSLELLYRLQGALCEIAGFDAVSLQPAAGAQGELAGVLMIRAYHEQRGDAGRTRMLIPDSAHGTNPASVAMAGFEAIQVPTDRAGNVDAKALREACDERTAGLMITNPNTLGLFEQQIQEVTRIVHEAGGLVYGDGANLNAILGIVRPGDFGVDVMHFNLHKTFSTPHGGGGPGAGPIGVAKHLTPFMPGPLVVAEGDPLPWENEGVSGADGDRLLDGNSTAAASSEAASRRVYRTAMPPRSIGRVKAFFGNFGMLVRAYTYIRRLGPVGLRSLAENAVLNANYLKALIGDVYPVKYNRPCMHEFVAVGNVVEGIQTMDVAKRLIDYGFHPPTVYFPLIVKEAMMIEPTESEGRETIEAFAETLRRIAREAREEPELLHGAPHVTPVSRLDEVSAARHPVLCYGG